jgi:hypothetical protein
LNPHGPFKPRGVEARRAMNIHRNNSHERKNLGSGVIQVEENIAGGMAREYLMGRERGSRVPGC